MSELRYQKITPSNILTSAARLAAAPPQAGQLMRPVHPVQVVSVTSHAVDRFIARGNLHEEIASTPEEHANYVYEMFDRVRWDRVRVVIAQRSEQDPHAPGRYEAVALAPVAVSTKVGDQRFLNAVIVSATRKNPAGILYAALNGKLKFRVVTFIPANSRQLGLWGSLELEPESAGQETDQETGQPEPASLAPQQAPQQAPQIPHKSHKKKNRFPKTGREHEAAIRIKKYNRFSIKDRKDHRAASSKRRHDSTVFEIRPCRRNLKKRRAAIEAFRRRRAMRLPPNRDAIWE